MMKRVMRWIGIVGLGIGVIVSLIVTTKNFQVKTGGQAKTKLTFVWWGANQRNENYVRAIRSYERRHPTVEIEYKYYSWDDYWKNLSAMIASGHTPDVMQLDVMYLTQYAQAGRLKCLDRAVAQKQIQTQDIPHSILAMGRTNGHLYAMTAGVNTMATFANQELLTQAGIRQTPATFQEWLQQMMMVKQKTGAYGYIDNGDVYVPLEYYLRTKGESLVRYRKDGVPELGFSEKTFMAFFDGFAKVARQQAIPSARFTENMKSADENPLATGQTAFTQNWAQQYTWTESAAQRHRQTLTLQLPYAATQTNALFYHPSIMFSMAKQTRHAREATRFINYLLNNESASDKDFGVERGLPANTRLQRSLYRRSRGNDRVVLKYMQQIKPYLGKASPMPPNGFSELDATLNRLYLEASNGKINGRVAYTSYVRKFKQIIRSDY